MSNAFIDTTVLTDILLKTGPAKEEAAKSLERYDRTYLISYAIKEFKRGPLKNFVWMYNKLASTGSFSQAIAALQAMSRTPRRYTTSTALEALAKASSSIGNRPMAALVAKYGADAVQDKVYCDELRLALKRSIFGAWARRRQVTTETVFPLSCYSEQAPYEHRRLIEVKPVACDAEPTCCLAVALRERSEELRKMKEIIDADGSQRAEDRRRAQALRRVFRTKEDITDAVCRDLGDAVLIALAPPDAVILTTNVRDFAPLATAVSKRVETPGTHGDRP